MTQQNRALKILYNKHYLIPTKDLHQDLHILLVNDIYKFSIAKFVYKQRKHILPNIFDKLFTENCNIHSHNTKHVEFPRNKCGQLKTKYQGTIIWNDILENIKNTKTIKTFSNNVKHLYLKLYCR